MSHPWKLRYSRRRPRRRRRRRRAGGAVELLRLCRKERASLEGVLLQLRDVVDLRLALLLEGRELRAHAPQLQQEIGALELGGRLAKFVDLDAERARAARRAQCRRGRSGARSAIPSRERRRSSRGGASAPRAIPASPPSARRARSRRAASRPAAATPRRAARAPVLLKLELVVDHDGTPLRFLLAAQIERVVGALEELIVLARLRLPHGAAPPPPPTPPQPQASSAS